MKEYLEMTTQKSARSFDGVASSASKQVNALKRPFAVFDIDGTLIRWQLYHAVVDKLAKQGLLGKDAASQVHEARMVWKRREHPDAFVEYEQVIIEVFEKALPTLDPVTFDEVVKNVTQEYKLQVYSYTRELLGKLKKQNYFLIAISGSHQELVNYVAEQFGFDDCIGSNYKRDGSQFSGEKFVASMDKKKVLKELIKKHKLSAEGSYGVGDSKGDIAMLEEVDNPIAFNPDRLLFNEAKKRNWKVIIERKNMIYELEPKNGDYILAKTNSK